MGPRSVPEPALSRPGDRVEVLTEAPQEMSVASRPAIEENAACHGMNADIELGVLRPLDVVGIIRPQVIRLRLGVVANMSGGVR